MQMLTSDQTFNQPFQVIQVDYIEDYLEEMSHLLIHVVEGGASIGFLKGVTLEDAMTYWSNVIQPEIQLLIAVQNEMIVGTIQLHMCMKPNGVHRVEIAKLMVHPDFRRLGIGRALMLSAENVARNLGKEVIILDTRKGDSSNHLYLSLEYILAGSIPYYTKSSEGFESTIIYFKALTKNTMEYQDLD
ncbi:GNAT family N-acetyltransferase [Exiguobacterium sp. s195]|uniref:GNAT family N-acetyltransferase n=1 Tax=Exiguobacterium sp. s195 TaxID=2751282 RepID=UPI001BECB6B5|nr:GNAT family N-acetyltransferase [Exiguobacterium sp. s195]